MRSHPQGETGPTARRRGPEVAIRTVAFADIVGSTALAEAGEIEAFRQVNRVLATFRRVARGVRGRIVQEAGDGALASFLEVGDAIAWAARCHGAVAQCHGGPDVRTGIRLRIGVHAGPVLLHGQRIFGRIVTIACRLQQAAEIGETLISSHVHDALGGGWGGQAARAEDLLIKGTALRLATYRIRPAAQASAARGSRPGSSRGQTSRACGDHIRLPIAEAPPDRLLVRRP